MKALYLMLALAMAASAAPNEPAAVAVEFLGKVRAGKVNLEPGGDTALTANTDETKRREIARRLERTASDLGNGSLEASLTQLDENLAAVLVRKVGGFNPSHLRVFAVALVKRGEAWLPAPVLASFENSGLGFAPGLRQRLNTLESWMLDQQALELDSLQQQTHERMRKAINTSLPLEDLRSLDARQVAQRFLDACGKQQLPAMLGLLGGLQTLLPDDWTKRLQTAEAAAADPQAAKRPWRLLVAADVLRTVVDEGATDKEAHVTIACLDPTGGRGNPSQPQVELIHLALSKSPDGLWQVDPPAAFFLTEEALGEQDPDADPDPKLLDIYPSMLRQDQALQPQPTPAEALKALDLALQAATLQPIMGMLDLAGDKKLARLGCSRAAAAWGALHDPACVRHALPLGVFETDSVAVASYQYFSAREPDRMDVRAFFFDKQAGGWHLLAGFKPDDNAQGNLLAAQTWAAGETKRRAETWRNTCLAESTHLTTLAAGAAPGDAHARDLVEAWLNASRGGKVTAALALTAWLDPEKSPARVLRNLGYEINGSRKSKTAATIISVLRGKTWTLVAVRANNGDKPSYPLYPVVNTPAGPKILIEIDLFANAERGREFLNSTAISHLRNHTSQEVTNELHDLFKQQADASGK